MSKKKRPHLSPSQLATYARCPKQYEFRYVDGLRIPPGAALSSGLGAHCAAESNNRSKLETRVDLPKQDLVEIADEAVKMIAADEGVWVPPEQEGQAAQIFEDCRTDARDHAGYYAEAIAPDYQPAKVESWTRIELATGWDFVGVIDMVDERQIIMDYKTTTKSKSQGEADDSLQLTSYYAMYHYSHGRPPLGIQLDVSVKLKKGMSRQIIRTERTHDDVSALANRLTVVASAIQKGVFAPTDPSNWCCSPRWCGYWSRCPFVVGSQRKG